MTSADEKRAGLVSALENVAGGNRAALREVYDMTSAKLLGVILRIMRDRDHAEDVLQEVYVKVWRRAARFDASKASPITWLCTIARNTAIDALRRSGKHGEAVGDSLPEVEDEAPLAEDMLCDAEDHDRLVRCLEALEQDQRRSIRMSFYDGLTHSQLADRMSVPLGTLKSWIRRGLSSLKGCLAGG
ncbi:sigma-70 family RNA polymerase sigma factor [Qipengyuania atrilutea]|uniref:RNA polymerase sigma factor n=1 Tax=Qipengyuania atrilutea TaxID=2744473 RepID=A0A850H205_9SPHN|nr:sigma-70 family RNA polymerase sigma factor [Actirhodobacter atriluteus]NVD44617.1 sigma-70 family RNA polymerase sigma factor [Actirhodobacter atriluteus]